MNFQQDRRFRNHLMQRVRRHSTVATLFRAPSNPESVNLMNTNQQTFQTLTASDAPQNFVQATWGGVERNEAVQPMPLPTPPLPAGSMPAGQLPSPPTRALTGNRDPGNRQGAQTRPDVAGLSADAQPTAVTPGRVQPARPAGTPDNPLPGLPPLEPVPAVPAEPGVVPTLRPPETSTESSLPDSVWRRLQTIFKRHQNPPNAPRQDENAGQVSSSAQAGANPAESWPTQQNSVIAVSENAVRDETPTPARTTSITNNTPDPPAGIQRSPHIEQGPVPQQASSEPIIQTGEEAYNLIPALSGRAVTPAGLRTSESDQATASPAEQTNREPFVSQPGDVEAIRNDVTDAGVESPSPASDAGLNVTPSGRGLDTQTTAVEQVVTTSPDRGARTPFRESTPVQQTATPALVNFTTTPVDAQPPPRSQIQRVTAPLDSPDAPPSPQEGVRDALSPEIQFRADDIPIDGETGGEDSMVEPQPVPLQDAWHVERLAARTAAPEPERAQSFVRQSESPYAGAIQDRVSRVLNSVAAQKPTSSSIEVVAPRRPRPVPLHGSGRIQRAAANRDSAPAQDQRHIAVSTQENSLNDSDGIVDTAIGPLPADLWTLIDEPVPPTVRRQSNLPRDTAMSSPGSAGPVPTVTQMHTTNPSATETDNFSRPFSDTGERINTLQKPGRVPSSRSPEPVRPVITPATASVPQQPAHIQRVAVPERSEDQTSSVEQSQSRNSTGTETGQEQEQTRTDSGVDIDDLAQKVYAEVKRKLTVEWERLRTRF